MSDKQKPNTRFVVIAILILVGVMNAGYGFWRMNEAREFSAALFIAAATTFIFAALLMLTNRNKS